MEINTESMKLTDPVCFLLPSCLHRPSASVDMLFDFGEELESTGNKIITAWQNAVLVQLR